jgi:ferredoxin
MDGTSRVVLEVLPPVDAAVRDGFPGRGEGSSRQGQGRWAKGDGGREKGNGGRPGPVGGPEDAGRARRLTNWLSGKTGRRADRTFRVRLLVQGLFATASILIGLQLARFYLAAKAGDLPLPTRPPGVEAYLPISGLMGILDWMYQGTLNLIHPAATVLILVALATAFFVRKGFCSWVCPVGFLSEIVARFGRWSFGRNFRVWTWLDIPLRSLKYLLLAFFLGSILAMSAAGLQAFIQSPYNRVAEVKMGLFFLQLGKTGTLVMGTLLLASIFITGAWCRYLCPYGALLGLFSWISPTKVTRDADACVSCGLCDKACMARLNVSKAGAVTNPECTGCMDCVAACPVAGALDVRTVGRRRVSALGFAGAVVGIFLAGYVGARATGAWANQITDQEYVERIQDLDSPMYGHPGR